MSNQSYYDLAEAEITLMREQRDAAQREAGALREALKQLERLVHQSEMSVHHAEPLLEVFIRAALSAPVLSPESSDSAGNSAKRRTAPPGDATFSPSATVQGEVCGASDHFGRGECRLEPRHIGRHRFYDHGGPPMTLREVMDAESPPTSAREAVTKLGEDAAKLFRDANKGGR